MAEDPLTIGEIAKRSGLAPSAIRYYERIGLIRAERTLGNQRRYRRDVLRRIAFVRIAQRVGLTLDEIIDSLSDLPIDRAPTAHDWQQHDERLARGHRRAHPDPRSAPRGTDGSASDAAVSRCGRAALANPRDDAGRSGPGPRYLLRR
jgi:MerR family redox-sensitive transcriptional activator SoxR